MNLKITSVLVILSVCIVVNGKHLLAEQEDKNEGYLTEGTRHTIICKGTSRNQRIEWLDPNGEAIPIIRGTSKLRVYTQEQIPRGRGSKQLLLIISHLLVEDTGEWTCKVGNTVRKSSLCVIEPPNFIDTPPEVTVDEGRSITLSCQAKGHPEPTIIWSRDDTAIADDDATSKYKVTTKYNSEGYEGLLTITDVSPDDAGVYTCEALQENGGKDDCSHVENFNITLHVNYPPVFENGNKTEFIFVMENETRKVNLSCRANGYPNPTYKFLERTGDNEYADMGNVEINIDENEASLDMKIDKSTIGKSYLCHATNVYGNAERMYKILKLKKPEKLRQIEIDGITHDTIGIIGTWNDEAHFPVTDVEVQLIHLQELPINKVVTPTEHDWKTKGDTIKFDEFEYDYNKLTLLLTDLEEERTFWIRLRASNEAGSSPWSEALMTSTTSQDKEAQEMTMEKDTVSWYAFLFIGSVLGFVVVGTYFLIRK